MKYFKAMRSKWFKTENVAKLKFSARAQIFLMRNFFSQKLSAKYFRFFFIQLYKFFVP